MLGELLHYSHPRPYPALPQAQDVNTHHHTNTCQKYNPSCRFKYPKYPAPHTIIVQPCQEPSVEKTEETLAKYHILLQKVKDVLEDKDKVDKIMEKYDKQNETPEEHTENIKKRIMNLTETAGVDYNEYTRALGTSYQHLPFLQFY